MFSPKITESSVSVTLSKNSFDKDSYIVRVPRKTLDLANIVSDIRAGYPSLDPYVINHAAELIKEQILKYLKAGKAQELIYWDKNSRFCPACGMPMKWHTAISKCCTHCGKEIWPTVATAIIVLVTRGDEALMVHARNFRGDYYGLVAGFVETGETLEECVEREVMEETGLRIRNIRYFASQPWPYPCGLMVGFTAEYESGEIKLQESELSAGNFFTKENMPNIPGKVSLARRLIDHWRNEG